MKPKLISATLYKFRAQHEVICVGYKMYFQNYIGFTQVKPLFLELSYDFREKNAENGLKIVTKVLKGFN